MASIMAFLILAATVGVSSSGGQDRVEPIDDVRVLNCNAIAFCLAGGGRCLDSDFRMEEWDKIAREYCGPELEFAGDLNRAVYYGEAAVHIEGRKILNRPSGKERSEEKVKDLGSATPHMVLAVPGMFFLSCLVICPCIRVKRKEQLEQKGLAKEQNSSDSISPLSRYASAEKNMTPPRSVPQSPTRFQFLQEKNRVGSLQLSINQIIKATQNFSPSLKLGEGGFGTVYKGVLDDGQFVAIKRAKTEHFATLRDEFMNEVKLLAKIDHRSLVRLIGYTDKGNERIIITEYVPNGTLREHLDGIYGHILDFNQRLEIAIDVAHALTYLHMYAEKPIIHRDVKASNILLTENFRAKVSDFGFARAGPTEAGQTHISTQIKGTAGYLDPEYLRTFQLTLKSDVFSFGILLIELLSARRPVDMKRSLEERITVRWAFAKFNEGNVDEVLDPNLREDVNIEVLTKMLRLAFHCAAPTRLNRPLMKEVGEQLWEIRKDFVKSLRAE